MAPNTPVFVDTNVILRTLDDGDSRMAADCRTFMRALAEGRIACWTTSMVVAEVAWTLRSLFNAPRERIATVLLDLVDIESLQIERKDMLRAALESYASTNVDFIDAYNAAEIRRRGQSSACTYDRDYDGLGITRVEPSALLP
jgi:predicted nucleic-acid-binding protein